MTMTSDQVLEVVSNLGKAGQKGRVAALRRFHTDGQNSTLTRTQRDLLDVAAKVPPVKAASYAHPAVGAGVASRPKDQALTPAELAWVQRLPADPTKVPFKDAQRLFALVAAVHDPADLRLLRSIADPIREHHDAHAAAVDLHNAAAPLVPAPPEALPALSDAIAAEHPELQADEVVLRASNMLQEHGKQRVAEQGHKVYATQRRVEQLKNAAADRVAVTR